MEKITIDLVKIALSEDNSVTDRETIRQLALHSIQNNDTRLLSKIDPRFEVCGLYPHTLKIHNIFPDKKVV